MTQYRLAALEYQQVVSECFCPTCGHEKLDAVYETRRYRQGDIIDVTGSEEARLLDAGALLPIGDEPVAEPVVVEDVATEDGATTEPAVVVEPSTDGEVKRPRKAGPVDEWRAYAVSKGVDAEEAAELTKVELIELVGED